MLLLAIFVIALLCLILGLAQIAEFLIWVGLIGIFVGLVLAVADWVRGRA